MRTDAERTQLTTKLPDASTADPQKCDDVVRTSTGSSNSDGQRRRSAFDFGISLPTDLGTFPSDDGRKWPGSRHRETLGSNCDAATEDSEDDSDCTAARSTASTYDELVADMQNLRLRNGFVEQLAGPLIGRGPPDGKTTRWSNDHQSSTEFAWPTPLNAMKDVCSKRKITPEPPTINFHPVPVTDTSLGVFPAEADRERWNGTGWSEQHVTKFRRAARDPPPRSDERAPVTFDSSLTSALTSGICGIFDDGSGLGELEFLPSPNPQCDFAQYCPEIGSDPFPYVNSHDDASSAFLFDTPPLTTVDEISSLNYSRFLAHFEHGDAPPANCFAGPKPEITSQRCHGDVGIRNMTMTTTGVGDDATTCPSTYKSPVDVNPGRPGTSDLSHRYVRPSCSWTAPALSPSADSGFVEVNGSVSPRSLTDDLSFAAYHHHEIPSDVIFDYVETKLREMARLIFVTFCLK